MALSVLMAVILIAVALFIGISGYDWIAGFGWIVSLLEASMILAGMGPVNPLPTAYALFSGLVLIAIMGIVLAPVRHRMLHQFHVDEKDLEK